MSLFSLTNIAACFVQLAALGVPIDDVILGIALGSTTAVAPNGENQTSEGESSALLTKRVALLEVVKKKFHFR